MLDSTELISLLTDLESDRVERKSSLSDKEKIREAICAFANDLPNHRLPGVIFIGVTDSGNCANYTITDEILRELASMRSDGNITPFPMLEVEKRLLNNCEMAIVLVHPSDSPPVRVRGRTWIRVGPRRDIASPQEERRLSEKRRAGDLPYDLQSVSVANLDDLDLDFFRRTYLPNAIAPDILEQNQRSPEEQLASVRFTSEGVPTVLGLLTIGKDVRSFVPGSYIQFVRFAGTGLGDTIRDEQEISGNLLDVLRLIDEKLQAHINVSLDITSASIETLKPDYPLVALQQLVRNAVMHRTYESTNAPIKVYWFDDRIEIQNPGGPFGLVTKDNFGQPGITDYRNPHLAEVMKNLGYVQRFGVGISIARREMDKNGNPPLEFNIQDNHVLAIIQGVSG